MLIVGGLTRIFHEKCARRAETPLWRLPERLFRVSPAQWPESNLLPATEILGRADPAPRAGSDAADIA